MARGKLITLYLKEGEVSGIVECTIDNWNGRIIRLPYETWESATNKLKELESTDNIQKMGVYILFSKSLENDKQDTVYIGQSREIFERLSKHLVDKLFSSFFIITNDGNKFTKSHIEYLEARLIGLADTTGEVESINTSKPNPQKIARSIHQSVVDEVETFIDYLYIIAPTIGLYFIKKIDIEKETKEIIKSPIFTIKQSDIMADMQVIDEKIFLVLEGSEAVSLQKEKDSLRTYRAKRRLLIQQGILEESGDKLIFKKSYPFSSSTEASVMVLGRSSTGHRDWVLKSKPQVSYGDYIDSEKKNKN